MSDDEFGDSPDHGGHDSSSIQRKGPRFSWTAAYETTFFHSLCESVGMGLKDNHSFKHEAWDRAMQALRERHAAYPNKGHLINKSDNARKKFRLWRGLREDSRFVYDATTRTVTAPDEVWKQHIEKEPLSRSLRGRPFEHEDFYEILFPDVIGSGGIPKRVTKARRRGPDSLSGLESDTPGTHILHLLNDGTFASSPAPLPSMAPTADMNSTTNSIIADGSIAPLQTIIKPPSIATATTTTAMKNNSTTSTSSTTTTAAHHGIAPSQIRPTQTKIPPRGNITPSSALTPPDENPAPQTRKRFLPQDGSSSASSAPTKINNNNLKGGKAAAAAAGGGGGGGGANKRRRTTNNHGGDLIDLTSFLPDTGTTNTGTTDTGFQGLPSISSSLPSPLPHSSSSSNNNSSSQIPISLSHESILMLADILSRTVSAAASAALTAAATASASSMPIPPPLPAPRWTEQAMDIFFRDFADEEMDLQVKIAEKMLTDGNKAAMFCKMPVPVRQHWVKRLREVHNRVGIGN